MIYWGGELKQKTEYSAKECMPDKWEGAVGGQLRPESSWSLMGAAVFSSALAVLFGSLVSCAPIKDNQSLPVEDGQPCNRDAVCAAGSVCNGAGLCSASGSEGTTAFGGECQRNDNCGYGLFCGPTGRCGTNIVSDNGDPCRINENCSDGLVCNREGLCAAPDSAGTLTSGSSCTDSSECGAGLTCTGDGRCEAFTPWAGVRCPESVSGDAPTVLFHVPRGEEERDYFSLPSPNDVQTTAIGTPRLVGFPGLGQFPAPGSILSSYLALAEGRIGFSAHGAIVFRFSHPLEYDSLTFGGDEGNFFFVDITPGTRNFGRTPPSRFFATAQRSPYICDDWIGIRPASGSSLMAGHTYAVYFRKGLLDSNEIPYEASQDLQSLLDSTPPLHPRMLEGWSKYGPFRNYLAENSIPVEDVVGATVFTVGDPRARFAGIRQAVANYPSPPLEDIHICEGGETSPCGETDFRRCGPTSDAFLEIHARALLPNFLRGAPPYDQYGGDAALVDGQPVLQRQEAVCISMTIPKSEPPPAGWPVALFAHDIGGHFRASIEKGLASEMASKGWVTLGFDGVLHGPRLGLTDLSANNELIGRLNNIYRPKIMVDHILQGVSDLHALAYMLDDVEVLIDGSRLPFDDEDLAIVSEGWGSDSALHFLIEHPHVHSGALAETAGDWLSRLLLEQSPIHFPNTIRTALNDPDVDAMHPGLHLIQHWLEQRDPVSFARLLRSPPGELSHKNVLLLYGRTSEWSSDEARAAFARATRMPTLAAYNGFLEGLDAVTPTELPLQGNIASRYTQGIKFYGSDVEPTAELTVLSTQEAQSDISAFFDEARTMEGGPRLEP